MKNTVYKHLDTTREQRKLLRTIKNNPNQLFDCAEVSHLRQKGLIDFNPIFEGGAAENGSAQFILTDEGERSSRQWWKLLLLWLALTFLGVVGATFLWLYGECLSDIDLFEFIKQLILQ